MQSCVFQIKENTRFIRRQKRRLLALFWIVGIVLFLVAWLKLLGKPADYDNYVASVRDPAFRNGTEEVFYRVILFCDDYFFSRSTLFFFFIYALVGVWIKLYLLLKKSKLPIYSLILYVPSYFLIHEYVQIRAAIAVGIFMIALEDAAYGRLSKYLFKIFLAILFHWSAAVLIPIYFLIRLDKWKCYFALPLVGICMNYFHVFSLLVLPNMMGVGMLATYFALHSGQVENVNIFNKIILFQLLLFVVATYYLRSLEHNHARIEDSILAKYKIFSVSIFLFFFFSSLDFPVIAFRLNEFLNIVLFFLWPDIVLSSKKHRSTLAVLGGMYFIVFSLNLIFKTGVLPELQHFITH